MPKNNDINVFLTIVMWLFMGIICYGILGGDIADRMNSGEIIGLVIAMFAIATVGTFSFLILPELVRLEKMPSREEEDRGKAKREFGSQQEHDLALLLRLLDEDEQQALKERLQRRALGDAGYADGELPYPGETLESLLSEEQTDRHLRR